MTDSRTHLHWQFFGFAFSTPLPEDLGGEDDDSDRTPAKFVLVADEAVPVVPVGPSLDRVCTAMTCVPVDDAVWIPEPVPRPPGSVSSLPLCDSARLDRSGVLLA